MPRITWCISPKKTSPWTTWNEAKSRTILSLEKSGSHCLSSEMDIYFEQSYIHTSINETSIQISFIVLLCVKNLIWQACFAMCNRCLSWRHVPLSKCEINVSWVLPSRYQAVSNTSFNLLIYLTKICIKMTFQGLWGSDADLTHIHDRSN